MRPWTSRAVTGATALAVCAAPALALPTAATAAVDPGSALVVNEVYGGGGNSGATYSHDFVEIANTGDAAVDVTGWSVQYASSAGTNWSGIIPLSGTIEPGGLYLVQAGTNNAAVGAPLPTPGAVGSANFSATSGNIALVEGTARLACATTACATDPAVVDLVGFGSGLAYAGTAAAPSPSATTSIARDADSTNTADNAADFAAGAPTPGAPTPGDDEEPPEVADVTIPEVQGTGAVSPLIGDLVRVSGVVTAAYPSGGYFGFVIQTPGSGGALGEDHDASHGLFVYQQSGAVGVGIGDHVAVTGTVAEFNGLTQVVAASADAVEQLTADGEAPKPVTGLEWPRTAEGREVLESMLFEPFGTYSVTNTYSTNQYGEVGLAFGDTPLVQPTDVARPLAAEALAVAADNEARGVVLDDGASTNFLSSANSSLTPPYVSLVEPVRVGATVTFPEPVVVDFRNNVWKFQPTTTVTAATSDAERASFENTREAAPDATRLGDGELTVAGFNVLNYFVTLGVEDPACVPYTDRAGDGVTVRTGCPQRGAWDEADLERQQSKIVDAITTLDADVTGLMEIENSLVVSGEPDAAVANLVAALNDEAGEERWAYVTSSDELPPAEEMDVISNAIIFQPDAVTPLGEMRVLGELSGEGEAFSNAREPLAQAFEPVGGGEPFLVVVNHFKSKGSGSGVNADQGDGQGASNFDRVQQATALRDWVPTVLAGYDTELQDTFLVGDFNSYTEEDPMHVLYDAGYVNVNAWMTERGFDREFSYSFSGLAGSLDHVLVSRSLLAEDRITGADIWEINAPESVALEYSRYNSHGTLFYEEGPFRSSDHDPVVVAFTRGEVPCTPTSRAVPATPATPGGPGQRATPATPATPAVPGTCHPSGEHPGKGKGKGKPPRS